MTEPPKAPPAVILSHVHELAFAELSDLLAALDEGRLVITAYEVTTHRDANGQPIGTKTYAFTVRQP